MTIDDTEAKKDSAFDLAPPPSFGIAERTDRHMLPVAMDMGAILDQEADDGSKPKSEDWPLPFPGLLEPSDEPASVDSGPQEPALPPDVERHDEVVGLASGQDEERSNSKWLILVALLAIVGVGAYVLRGDSPSEDTVAAAAPTDPAPEQPEPARVEPVDAALQAKLAAANNIGRMKAATPADRQALLSELEAAGLTAQVELDLHIALDLLQADQGRKPCEMFSDALTLIESSADRTPFAPAIASVTRAPEPSGLETSSDCAGLDERLAALKAQPVDDAGGQAAAATGTPAPEARSAPTKRRAKKKSKKRAKATETPAPPPPVPASQPKPPPEPKPTEPPKPRPSVANKLDDGLRNLD